MSKSKSDNRDICHFLIILFFSMQIESFLIMNFNEEILFSCNVHNKKKLWETYLEDIRQCIPKQKSNIQIYSYDEFTIAIREIKPFKLLVTIPSTSLAKVEPAINSILDQLEKMVRFCSDGELSQETLTERDHYIRLRMLCQKEFSVNGYMTFIPESEFPDIVAF